MSLKKITIIINYIQLKKSDGCEEFFQTKHERILDYLSFKTTSDERASKGEWVWFHLDIKVAEVDTLVNNV